MSINPVAAVDFESTFFPKRKIGLKTMGVDQYLWHPETKIYLAAIDTSIGSMVCHPFDFDWESIAEMEWVSHNAGFDRRVWRRLCHLRPSLAQFTPKVWHCTANMVSWLGAPRDLKGACLDLLNADVSKDARKKMENKTWEELRDGPDWKEIVEYAGRDSYWCRRLWEEFSPMWPDIEQRISEMTTAQVMRGLPCDKDYIDESIKKLERACWDARGKLPWCNGSSEADEAVLSHVAVAEECKKLGISPPKSLAEDSDDCRMWEAEHPDIPWVQVMRRYRKANLLLSKFVKMRDRIRPFDGRIDFSQKYCGAHTKRASGDAGFNVQGFQRDPLPIIDVPDGTDLDSIADEHKVDMRRAIHTMNGGVLPIADLAQIEPRTLAWMVNDRNKIELINKGISVYEIHARQTLGWEGGKLKDEDKKKYALCKMRVLGLSYGCGWNKFISYCLNEYGHIITPRESKMQVNDFRKKERLIKEFWDKMHAILIRSEDDGILEIDLPSWNTMRYRDIKSIVEKGRKQYVVKLNTGRRNRVWGSLIVENIIQATARDCFYEKLLKLEDGGLPTLFAVHDEGIGDEVPMDQAKDALEFITEVMEAPCDWMPGIALGSEAQLSPFYLK